MEKDRMFECAEFGLTSIRRVLNRNNGMCYIKHIYNPQLCWPGMNVTVPKDWKNTDTGSNSGVGKMSKFQCKGQMHRCVFV